MVWRISSGSSFVFLIGFDAPTLVKVVSTIHHFSQAPLQKVGVGFSFCTWTDNNELWMNYIIDVDLLLNWASNQQLNIDVDCRHNKTKTESPWPVRATKIFGSDDPITVCWYKILKSCGWPKFWVELRANPGVGAGFGFAVLRRKTRGCSTRGPFGTCKIS